VEILNMTFAGVPVTTILIVVGVGYGVNRAWKEWREDRAMVKEVRESMEKFDAEHEWKPHMVNGVDCGEWIRKDGRPVGIDD
jgi:hypothetical protein